MAWLWWLLAPVVSTGLGAVGIWWRSSGVAGRRFRRADPMAEHQALLRALARHQPVVATTRASSSALATDQPAAD